MFLINSYTTGLSQTVLTNILKLTVESKYKGYISANEIGLPVNNSDIILPCGIFARWEKDKYED
jgi:23S rRNA (cytosine1962-C5)-methyltransferase